MIDKQGKLVARINGQHFRNFQYPVFLVKGEAKEYLDWCVMGGCKVIKVVISAVEEDTK